MKRRRILCTLIILPAILILIALLHVLFLDLELDFVALIIAQIRNIVIVIFCLVGGVLLWKGNRRGYYLSAIGLVIFFWTILLRVIGVLRSDIVIQKQWAILGLALNFSIGLPAAFGLIRDRQQFKANPAEDVPKIDLPKTPFVFPKKSIQEIQGFLKEKLPGHAKVTVRDGKQTQIRIQDGIWRGAWLEITSDAQQSQLTRLSYFIPSLIAKVLILVVSVAVTSIMTMDILFAVIGKFVPVSIGIGGAAGFGMYTIVKHILIVMIKNSWSGELHQAIETLQA